MTTQPMHISEDQLIDLLGGLLAPDDERDVMAHLGSCALCEDHLRMLAREREALRARPQPRVVGGEIMLPRYEVVEGHGSILRSRRARWAGAITVAAAAITIALATHLFSPSRSDAFDYWLPTPPAEMPRTDLPGPPTKMQMALEAYEEHDPARALALLENASEPKRSEQTEIMRRLYQASALVNDNRAGEAQQVLDDLNISELPQPWRARATWVRYVTLRKTRQNDLAASVLAELVTDPGEIGEMARKERERLSGD